MKKNHQKNTSDLLVSTHSGANEAILKLLRNTTLGTPGKLRYKQTEVEKNVSSLRNLEFIQIQKRDHVLGTAGIIKRKISLKDRTIDSLYVRYLSVYNPIKRFETKPTHFRDKSTKSSTLRDKITSVFTEELEEPFLKKNKSGVFYAYVESENSLSKNLCRSFGFNKVRSVLTLLFTRLFPKLKSNVVELKNNELELFKEGITSAYIDHNFVFTDHIEDHGTCFVYKEKDEVIAGIRAIPVKWKIIEMPGFKGFLMQKVLPKLPILHKIFNPEHLQFLAFDSIWAKEKSHNKISLLMEHACAKLGFNMGMIWGDSESEFIMRLLASNKLGFLHKINGTVEAELLVRTINMNIKDETEFQKRPAFISAVDMT